METDSLATQVNVFHFLEIPGNDSSSRNKFLNKFFIPYGADRFFVLWKPFLLLNPFFYKWKLSMKLVETHFSAKKTISASKKGFSVH